MALTVIGIEALGFLMILGLAGVASRLDARSKTRAAKLVFRTFGPPVGLTVFVTSGVVQGWSAGKLALFTTAAAFGGLLGVVLAVRGTRRRHRCKPPH